MGFFSSLFGSATDDTEFEANLTYELEQMGLASAQALTDDLSKAIAVK